MKSEMQGLVSPTVFPFPFPLPPMRLFLLFFCVIFMTAGTRVSASQQEAPVEIEVLAEGTKARLSVFVSTPEGRKEVLKSEGFVGRSGVGRDKKEGDGKTPLGVYDVKRAFGLAENPGTGIPYVQVTSADVWVDDPASRYYNQSARNDAPDKDWQSAEKLIEVGDAYKYAAVIEYNTTDIVKGAGSAIFLHCSTGRPTAGCISIPEKDMKQLLRLLVPGTRIRIMDSSRPLR